MELLVYPYNGASKNRLTAVADAPPNTPNFADDVEGTESFEYDAIGHLTLHKKVLRSFQQRMTWNAYGKVQSVTQHRRNLSTGSMVLHSTMTFGYDAQQHRLKKSVTVNGVTKTTYYIRDAQGNPLAVYERTNGTTLTWKEQDLYGSSRLGMQKPEKVVTGYLYYDCPNGWYGSWTKSGAKSYELSNHLGNVMAVISDRGVLQSAQDYFPFGMAMPGRSSETPYKYGFNGQEKDTEMGGGVYTAEFWQYDARLGRRMNVDPVTFPWQSTYATFNNNPIALSDPTGAVAENPPGGGGDPNYDPKKDPNAGHLLGEVLVKAKWWDKLKAKASKVVENLKQGAQKISNNLKGPSITFVAATDAFISDMAYLPRTRYQPSDFPGYEADAKRGQSSGHSAAIVASAYEATAGGDLMVGGGLALATGVGAPGGAVALAGGAVMTAHGSAVLRLATANLVKMAVDETADAAHSTPEPPNPYQAEYDVLNGASMNESHVQGHFDGKSKGSSETFGSGETAQGILNGVVDILKNHPDKVVSTGSSNKGFREVVVEFGRMINKKGDRAKVRVWITSAGKVHSMHPYK